MRSRRLPSIHLVFFSFVGITASRSPAIAQDTEVRSSSGDCESDAHHALDARLGDWYQTSPDDRLHGEVAMESVLGGCAVWERWHGTSGGQGISLNAYDARSGVWRHMWVNSVPVVILAEGVVEDDAILWRVAHHSGELEPGEVERWVWSMQEPIYSRVETSKDGGRTWELAFDDRFHRWSGSLPENYRPRSGCSIEIEHHALAFWTGAWIIESEAGDRIGGSRVDLTLQGCAMREEGFSEEWGRYVRFLGFDGRERVWRMLTVTDRGEVHVAHGSHEDGRVRWTLAGDPEPGAPLLRWTLERGRDDGTVLWLADESTDGGVTWRTTATRTYRTAP